MGALAPMLSISGPTTPPAPPIAWHFRHCISRAAENGLAAMRVAFALRLGDDGGNQFGRRLGGRIA